MNDSTNIQMPSKTADILTATKELGFNMASDSVTCSLLRALVASKKNAQILELGAGTGLSASWILDGMDAHSCLTTVDNDEKGLAIVRQHLGDDPRLTIVSEDANQYIASLQGKQFDLIFADTWAGKYQMLEEALALLVPSGIYFVDDMLPQSNWPEGHSEKAARLIEQLEQISGFHICKLSWGSGVIILTKI